MDEIKGYLTPIYQFASGKRPADTMNSSSDSESEGSNSATNVGKSPSKSRKSHMHSVIGTKTNDGTLEAIPLDRLKFIPLRLSSHERMLLNVLINALEVCEYTDVVDVTFSHTRKSKLSRIMESLVDILSISAGLVVANNLPKGEQLISKTLNENVPFFSELFEVITFNLI